MAPDDMRVETQNLANGDLTLDARDGEALQIKMIGVSGASAGAVVEEYVREELMRSSPAADGRQNIIKRETVYDLHTDLYHHLADMGLRVPELVVPEGHTYTMSSTTDDGQAVVVYREVEPGQVGPNSPGGPGTKTRTYVSIGQAEVDLAAQGSPAVLSLDQSRNPAQLPDVPFVDEPSPSYEYDLQAMMLGVSGDSTDGNAAIDGFRLTTDETDFLARDSAFVSTSLAQYPTSSFDTMPLIFGSEPTYQPGDELEIDVNTSGAGDGTVVVDACLIYYRRGI